MMKTLIISDLHGENPSEFISQQIKQGIEKLVALGDYDAPEILEYLLDDLGIPKIILIGNHDYDLARGIHVESNFLKAPSQHYIALWRNGEFSRAREFVLKNGKLRDNKDETMGGLIALEKLNEKKIVYVHASLPSPDKEGKEKIREMLWRRMVDSETSDSDDEATFYGHFRNFELMARKNYWLMFRGHGHFSGVLSQDASDIKGAFKLEEEMSLKLNESKRYIVNIGSFRLGDYAVFDSETMTIEYKKWGNQRKEWLKMAP